MWQQNNSVFVVLLALCLRLDTFSTTAFVPPPQKLLSFSTTTTASRNAPSTELHWFFGRGKNKNDSGSNSSHETSDSSTIRITNTQPDDYVPLSSFDQHHVRRGKKESADIVIVGGGVSGLAAAITAAKANKKAKIVLLEASSKLGGRVQSVQTEDGFVLDEGFAVFIDQYPEVQKLLDFDALKLKPFLPGALVKLKGSKELARVADPLRNPEDLLPSALAPVGSLLDKIEVLPLVLNVRTKTVQELFEERESDTLTVLKDRYGFSDDFIGKFLKPFLEGIYLAPLDQQSSRMFSFVFKMFSEGSATLPAGGMKAVADQLATKAKSLGVEIRTDTPVSCIASPKESSDDSFLVECVKTKERFETSSLIVATDGKIAQKLLANIEGFESLENLPAQPQLSVGCLYYTFKGSPPIEDPILILNGIGDEAGNKENPVNNICFPSVVNDGYAPNGYSLCSVTVLSKAMEMYKDSPEDLDKAVRRQLSTWFEDQADDIKKKWELKKIFYVSTV
jgi:phytoene dehydrogenase-like protein